MDISPENASQEAIHAAKNAAQAVEVARVAQIQAHDDKTREMIVEVIKSADFPSNQELKSILDSQASALEELSKKLDPILDVYRAVLLSKSFIMGVSGLVIAVTAIGVGFTWLINSVVHKG